MTSPSIPCGTATVVLHMPTVGTDSATRAQISIMPCPADELWYTAGLLQLLTDEHCRSTSSAEGVSQPLALSCPATRAAACTLLRDHRCLVALYKPCPVHQKVTAFAADFMLGSTAISPRPMSPACNGAQHTQGSKNSSTCLIRTAEICNVLRCTQGYGDRVAGCRIPDTGTYL